MNKILLTFTALFSTLTQADIGNSFGAHDPFKTKGAFAEMYLNNTATETEMFVRTAGLFAHLQECSKQCKKHPELATKVLINPEEQRKIIQILFNNRIKINNLQHTTPHLQETIELIDETFAQSLQIFKGTRTHRIAPFLLIEGGNIFAALTLPLENEAVVAVDVHRIIVPLQQMVEGKNEIQDDDTTEDMEYLFALKQWLLQYMKKYVARSSDSLEATFMHELSHPATITLAMALRHENPCGLEMNEAYTHTLAVLNSPTPLETGFWLLNHYYSHHLPQLMQDLEKEGVTWTDEELRTATKRLFFADKMLQSFAPDNNH